MLADLHKSALLWQKEASDKSYISCKRAKCVCLFHWHQWNIMMSDLTYLLPISHLACDGSTEPVSCLYPPFRAASTRLWDFCTDSWGSAASTIWFSEKFYKFEKNCKPVARRHVVGGIAQSLHGLRTISVRRLRRLHGNCTDIARFPYNLRTVSVRIFLPRVAPEAL